jgi:predicted RNase H-like nuclease
VDVLAIGADGIRNGWVAVACSDTRTKLLRFDSVAQIVAWRTEHAASAVVGLDVPMGLLEDGGARPCDSEARRLLAGRASSVFNPPARYLLDAMDEPDHAARWVAVQRLVAERAGVRVSRQTLGIMDKVKEADEYISAYPQDQDWVVEVHPELSFLALNGGAALPGPKRSAAGLLRRLELVQREFPDAQQRIETFEHARHVPLADILDADAAAWSARRWRNRARDLRILGDESPPPGRLAMRIVV